MSMDAVGSDGSSELDGERAQAMLREAGFTDVVVHRLEHDIVNDYYVARV